MRQLDTCDFCGDPADGVYDVVPSSVADQPRRLALCDSCRHTLEFVVEPLLDAAQTAAGGSTTDSTAGENPTDAATGETGESATEPGRPGEGDRPGERDSSGGDAESVTGAQSPSDGDSGSDSGDGEDGVTIEDETEENEQSAGSADRPAGYGHVLRLLQNRDAAMPRDDLRALATNAYDLDSGTFEDAVDAAVENGDVEETPDGLRTA